MAKNKEQIMKFSNQANDELNAISPEEKVSCVKDKFGNRRNAVNVKLAKNSSLPSDWVREVIGETSLTYEKIPTIKQDMIAAGLVRRTPLTTRHVVAERFGFEEGADIDMLGNNTTFESGDYSDHTVAVPVFSKGVRMSFRDFSWQGADRIREAMRLIANAEETAFFKGSAGSYKDPVASGGAQLYGATNTPGVNSATWNEGATDLVGEILNNILNPLLLRGFENIFLYFSNQFEATLERDYKSETGGTLRNRLMQIANVGGVRTSKALTNTEAVAISMDSRCCHLAEALPFSQMPTLSQSTGTSSAMKLLAVSAPVFRRDTNGRTGVVYAT